MVIDVVRKQDDYFLLVQKMIRKLKNHIIKATAEAIAGCIYFEYLRSKCCFTTTDTVCRFLVLTYIY